MILKMKRSEAALIFIGAALFLYILARAFFISFTHDEAHTVLEYATQPWSTINDVTWTNNHLLNSWLCRLNMDCFGASEFSFRWPNVFAGLLYIVFGIKIIKKIFGDNWIGVAAFVVLICNTFLVDFFGLARGYGLSMGLLMTGLYYLLRYLETGKILLYGGTALVAFALALIANYTLLNFFLLFNLFFFLHALLPIFTGKFIWKEKLAKLLAYVLMAILVVYYTSWFTRMMLKMRAVGNFNFGGEDGFWINTIHSLLDFSCGPIVHSVDLFYVLLTGLAFLLFIGCGIIITLRLKRNRFTPLNWFSVFLFLVMFGCGCAIWLQHKLMQVPFSADRAALYFLVLFPLLLTICFFTDGTFASQRKIAAGTLLAFPVLCFFLSVNFNRTLLWPFNANTKEAVEKIIEDSRHMKSEGKQATVAVSFLDYPVYNYYVFAEKATWMNYTLYGETGFQPGADYYLRLDTTEAVPPAEYKVLWQKGEKQVYRNTTKTSIVELKNLGMKNFEEKDRANKAPGHSGLYSELVNENTIYSAGFSDTLTDTLRAGTIIACNMYIWPENIRTSAKFIILVKKGSDDYWKAIYLSWLMQKEKDWNEIDFQHTLQTDLFPGNRVIIYAMTGKDAVAFRIDDFSVRYINRVPN